MVSRFGIDIASGTVTLLLIPCSYHQSNPIRFTAECCRLLLMHCIDLDLIFHGLKMPLDTRYSLRHSAWCCSVFPFFSPNQYTSSLRDAVSILPLVSSTPSTLSASSINSSSSGVDDTLLVDDALVAVMMVLLFATRPHFFSLSTTTIFSSTNATFLLTTSCRPSLVCTSLASMLTACVALVVVLLHYVVEGSRIARWFLVTVGCSTKRALYRFCDLHFFLTNPF